MLPSEYSGSSIPIPGGLKRWMVPAQQFDNHNVTSAVAEADLSKLYEAALSDNGVLERAGRKLYELEEPSGVSWPDIPEGRRECYLQDAQAVVAAALGYEITPDGPAALGLGEA